MKTKNLFKFKICLTINLLKNSFFTESLQDFRRSSNAKSLDRRRGHAFLSPPPSVRFLSFSCSFQQKFCWIMGWRPPWFVGGSLGNPRSATEYFVLLLITFSIIFTACKRSLGQGNVFTPVCDSVHRVGGVCPIACWDTHTPGQTPPWANTPSTDTPWTDTSVDWHLPPWADTPLG